MGKTLKIGDRVAHYSVEGRVTGTLVAEHRRPGVWDMKLDGYAGPALFVHEKSLRKLRPAAKPRTFWLTIHDPTRESTSWDTEEEAREFAEGVDEVIQVREVLRSKK